MKQPSHAPPEAPALPERWSTEDPGEGRTPGRRRLYVGAAIAASALGLMNLGGVSAGRLSGSSGAAGSEEEADAFPGGAAAAMQRAGVFARGRLEPRGQIRSVAPAESTGGSTVVELHVSVGDWVEQGEVLAVLDRADYLEAACEAAEARLREAALQRDLEELIVQASLAEREAAANSARARLDLARVKLDRRLAMDSRATTKEAVDDARLEQRSADSALVEAASRISRYAMPASGMQLDVRARSAQVDVVRLELKQARLELETAFVRAPMDGAVLEIFVREGERIGTSPIVELADTRQMFARMEVYETDAAKLGLDDRVEVTSPALERPLDGRVVWISSRVQQQSVIDATPAANTDARVIEVLAELASDSSAAASSLVSLQVRGRFLP